MPKENNYVPLFEVYSTVLENKEELCHLIDYTVAGDSRLEAWMPAIMKSLYNYNITGDKFQKLWDLCEQNIDMFKLNLFLLNAYDCGIEFEENQKIDNNILNNSIQRNMELDEPVPFVENMSSLDYENVMQHELWNDFCIHQAHYLVATLREQKTYTK